MDRRGLEFLAPDDPRVERIWRSLAAYGEPSYSLSWGWMSNWLAALPDAERPTLAVMHTNEEPTAAFFLAQRRVRRNLVMQSNALYFNGCGIAKHDDLCAGHNGLVAAPGARRSLAHVLELLPDSWDELHVPAIGQRAFDDLARLADHYRVRVEREQLAPFVDLATVRSLVGGYEAALPRTSRARIERARESAGDIRVEFAADRHHAFDIYAELLRLRSTPANEWLEAFHRRLIIDRLQYGEIQLVRIARSDTTLGCLFNVVHHERVTSLASGCSADVADAHAICHAVAIDFNARAGNATYDVADETLATGAERLVWLRVQRPAAWVSIEDAARRWYDSLIGDRRELSVA